MPAAQTIVACTNTPSSAQRLSLFIILVSSFFLSACKQTLESISPDTKTLSNSLLALSYGREPFNIDPHTDTTHASRRLQRAIYQGLVTRNPDSLDVEAALAEKWDISRDGKSYTFTLREDARWSNGESITSEDFIASWKTAHLRQLSKRDIHLLDRVLPSQSIADSARSTHTQAPISALSSKKLKITLKAPNVQLLNLLSAPIFSVVHKYQHFNTEPFNAIDSNTQGIISSGPYKIKHWKNPRTLILEKNPFFYGYKNVSAPTVTLLRYEDPRTEATDFLKQKIHATYLSSKKSHQDESQALNKIGLSKRSTLKFSTHFIQFNTRQLPTSDINFRKALSQSINRDGLTQKTLNTVSTPAFHLTPPNINGYTSLARHKYDLANARQHFEATQNPLTQVNSPPNMHASPIPLTVGYFQQSHEISAVAIAGMWQKHFRVRPVIVQLSATENAWPTHEGKEVDIIIREWTGLYFDASAFLELFISGSPYFPNTWQDDTYDELLFQAQLIKDVDKRYKTLRDAEEILLEIAPITPLYYSTRHYYVSRHVKHWRSNALDYQNISYLLFEPTAAQEQDALEQHPAYLSPDTQAIQNVITP